MKKSIRIFIAAFLLVLGAIQTPNAVAVQTAIPAATSDFYVNDFADVFSDDEKSRLMDNAVTLSDEHDGIQVVVTTINSLEGNSIENYALEMYNQYGIGKNDMGLLILLSTGDRQIRVEVGLAMEAYVNDSKAGRFIDEYAIPSLKGNKFAEGLINLQEALISEIVSSIETGNTSDVQTSHSESSINLLSALGTFLIFCIIVGLIVLLVSFVRKIISKSHEKQLKIDSLTMQLEASNQKAIEQKNVAKREINALNKKINDLTEEKDTLLSNYHDLDTRYNTLMDRYERVKLLYPNADNEVTAMIEEEIRQKDIALAQEVDSCIQKVINLLPSKDIVSELSEAISHYTRLSSSQKTYVKSDINKLQQLYDQSFDLKQKYDKKMEEERRRKLAAEAIASITAIISSISIGRARNLRQLKEAKSIYDNLEPEARTYFDKSVEDKLDKLYKEAKRDKEEEEAEYRRRQDEERRRRMQSSSYSSSSSSHFGGFGGHSGGGGASRGF